MFGELGASCENLFLRCTIPFWLREKCRHTEVFLVCIFPHLDRIRRDTEYQKNRSIWTLFIQCLIYIIKFFTVTPLNPKPFFFLSVTTMLTKSRKIDIRVNPRLPLPSKKRNTLLSCNYFSWLKKLPDVTFTRRSHIVYHRYQNEEY